KKEIDLLKTIEKLDFEEGIPEDFKDFPKQTVNLLKQTHLKITAAESLTAGMFQATVATIPGASNVFDGGFVTYADSSKVQLMGTCTKLIEDNSGVSGPVALTVAKSSAEKIKADSGVGFTGVAAPNPLEGYPVGTVFTSTYNRTNNEKIVKEF